MKTAAIELIAKERERQINIEGWTSEHDKKHDKGELALAAAAYALAEEIRDETKSNRSPYWWPWENRYWRPTPNDRTRELVKAGALIVAEIERLQGTENNNGWIRIESEEGLPKDSFNYYLYCSEGRILRMEEYEYFKKYIDTEIEATHYQPIVKPKPPVY